MLNLKEGTRLTQTASSTGAAAAAGGSAEGGVRAGLKLECDRAAFAARWKIKNTTLTLCFVFRHFFFSSQAAQTREKVQYNPKTHGATATTK